MLLDAIEESRPETSVEEYDAVIVGAGFAGLYQLYKLREAGLRVRLFEAGSGVGGVWYWNRYPRARFDAQSYIYQYLFSEEVLAEWDWQERFPGQPDLELYLNFVADRFSLKQDIEPRRVCRRLQLLRRWSNDKQDNEQVCA